MGSSRCFIECRQIDLRCRRRIESHSDLSKCTSQLLVVMVMRVMVLVMEMVGVVHTVMVVVVVVERMLVEVVVMTVGVFTVGMITAGGTVVMVEVVVLMMVVVRMEAMMEDGDKIDPKHLHSLSMFGFDVLRDREGLPQ